MFNISFNEKKKEHFPHFKIFCILSVYESEERFFSVLFPSNKIPDIFEQFLIYLKT